MKLTDRFSRRGVLRMFAALPAIAAVAPLAGSVVPVTAVEATPITVSSGAATLRVIGGATMTGALTVTPSNDVTLVFRDSVENVFFGAKPVPVQDDTAYIQGFIDRGAMIPPGIYTVRFPIVVSRNNTTIWGAGPNLTVLRSHEPVAEGEMGAAIRFEGIVHGLVVRDIEFDMGHSPLVSTWHQDAIAQARADGYNRGREVEAAAQESRMQIEMVNRRLKTRREMMPDQPAGSEYVVAFGPELGSGELTYEPGVGLQVIPVKWADGKPEWVEV